VLNAGMIKKMDNAPPIFLGSTKDDVLKVLGAPGQIDSSNQNKWQYGLGYIYFSSSGQVTGWYNYNGVLNAGMNNRQDNAVPIFLGSSEEDVLMALGAPRKIDSTTQIKWEYGLGYVYFGSSGQVTGWYNYNGVLSSALHTSDPTAPPVRRGATMGEVLRALGSPSKIDPSKRTQWSYGLAYVTFDSSGLVNGWRDYNNTLGGKVIGP